ncbi:MAG: HupE/UreJ family protein [Methylococcaceae bacterium]|nr:HupE/UreJ family protein [Methylococcaceae bacterium]
MLTIKIPALLVLLAFGQFAFAHPPGLSSAELSLGDRESGINLTFAMQDIEAFVSMDNDLDAEVTPAELTAAKSSIATLVASEMQITVDESHVISTVNGDVGFDDQNNVHVRFLLTMPVANKIRYQSKLLNKMAAGHKQYLTVKNQQGRILIEKMLTQQDNTFLLDLSSIKANKEQGPIHSNTFTEFVQLGIEHILTGYDHLLFLLSLLVVTHRFWPALKIITFFTLAHSITLALASFNVINFPGSIVEPLIAVTIVYVALENIWRGEQVKGREWLTFFFGLIHGFGFASVLREMNIGDNEGGILLPLFSFNLGVELGQISVAALVLPIIWWLHRRPLVDQWLAPACSILTGIAGTYWLVDRTLLS